MITLDQVLLLEQKVESAVAKIQQLQQENDALRSKCSELTNALSSKSEQLSSFENNQNVIECGIRKALDRLTSIENSVLKNAGQVLASQTSTVETKVNSPIQEKTIPQHDAEELKPTIVYNHASFDTMSPIEANSNIEASTNSSQDVNYEEDIPMDFEQDFNPEEELEDESQDDLGFDIF